MTTTTLPGEPPIDITLRRSARARRLSIRVSALDGRVTLTMPSRAPESDALAFAADRRDWIARALSRVPDGVRIADGALVPIDGRAVEIATARIRRPVLDAARLTLPAGRPGAALAGFLKARARDRLAAASDRHAAALGVGYRTLALRDARSRWGSCSADGRLMFSWRLAMAPPDVLDYVAAHEVAHLVRMDHSSAFWAVVTRLRPDWKRQRDWLRSHGAGLHRIRFED